MPVYIAILFPFFFIAWFLFVLFILSRIGWAKLASKYTSTEPFNGTSIGIISARIGMVNYNNVIRATYNDEGIHFKLILIFKLFHKPVFIPWNEFRSVEEKSFLGFKTVKMFTSASSITMKRKTYALFKDVMEAKQNSFSAGRN